MLPVANPDVVFAPVEAGAVLFSIPDETYYSLNSVGARVWQLLPPVTSSLDQLCEAIHAEYPDVPLAEVHTDIQELLDDLARMGLVRYAAGTRDGAGSGAPRVA